MSSTTQALKRLGVGGVAVVTVLSMPYGVTAAYAATPADPTVAITSQKTNSASPRNDGTDTTVKISANVAYTPSATAAENTNAPAGVKFSYTPTGGAAVVIATDSTFPYSVNWTPPTGGGAYTLTAQAVLANGSAVGTADTQATTVVDAPTVHISSPAEGGTIGAYGGNIAVSGTRSADLPALSIKAASRDNSTGVLSAYGAATAVAAGGSQAWTASVAVPACTAPSTSTCDVVIYAATTGGAAQTDEVTEAAEYAQTLTTVTVAPPSANVPAGSTQTYTVTVSDQNGKPVAGLKVDGKSSNTAVAASPGVQSTDGTGVATFPVATSGTTPGSTTLTFQTWTNGASYNSAVDFSRTATLTTYASTPSAATLTATPSKADYAEQTEYTINGASTDFPQVKFCVTDQNGNSAPAGVGQAPVLSDSRRDSTLAASAAPINEPVTATPIAGTGCYYLDLAPASGTYGTDTITGYFEQNGTPGQQAGDPAATPLVLNYGNLGITALDTQAQKGTDVTVSFKVLDPNGRPFANRTVTLTTGSAGAFTGTQPSGTSTTPPAGSGASAAANTLYGTTDANGVVSATVNSATVQNVQVTATDNLNTATQKATGQSAVANVDFRNASVAVTTLTQNSAGTLVQPTANQSAGNARPGDVIDGIKYTLTDANGGVLKNVAVTVSLDHGFFVGTAQPACAASTPNPERYTNCPFVTPPADGAQTGPVKNAGTTTLTTDSTGAITFSVSIGRDAGFDDDGSVVSTLTAAVNGGTKTAAVGTFTTAAEPINGGSVKLVPVSPTTALSGDVATQSGSNLGSTTPGSYNPVVFAVHVTDQYGNLVQLPANDVDLTATGGQLTNSNGTGGTATRTADGSFTGAETKYYLESTTTSTSGTPATVTATWKTAPVTNFKGTTVGTTTTYTTAAGTPTTKTDSFTVNFYAIDLSNLAYTFTSTPGNSVPVNTAVTTSVTVKDQKGNPVQGLNVNFVRSGPNDASGASQTGGTNSFVSTNTAGKAGTQYSSGTPGTATVTVIVTDGSGNELSRGVQNVTFTSGSTPPPAGPVTINGSTNQFVNFQQRVIIAGKAPANSTVTVYFHRVNVAGLTFKTFPADANGNWGTKYDATDDYVYFAVVGSNRSAAVNSRMNPSLSTRSATVAKGTKVTLSGRGGNRTRVYVHVGGTIASIRTAPGGTWTYQFTATKTVSVYATRPDNPAGTRSAVATITVG